MSLQNVEYILSALRRLSPLPQTNAILDSVHSHFILINRGSRLEKLMFKEQNFIGTSGNRKIKASTEIVKSDTYEGDKKRIESTVNERRKIQENAASTNSSPGEKILQMIKIHMLIF